MEKLKKKKILIIVPIVILLIVLIGAIIFIRHNSLKDKEQYTLDIYKGNNYYCESKNDYCNTLAFKINTKTKDAKILTIDSKGFILYQDNSLKIYDINKKEIIKTNLESTYDDYQFIEDNNEVIGIIYKNNNYYSYYNLKINKKMYENKYTSLVLENISNEKVLVGYDEDNNKTSILNINEENVKLSCNNYVQFVIETYNNKNLIIGEIASWNSKASCIFANDKQLLTNEITKFNYAVYKGNIYINDNGYVKKFDFDGNLLDNKNIGKDKVSQIINNYALYNDNNSLILYNIDTKKEFKVLDMKDNYYNVNFNDDSPSSLPPTGYYSEYKSLNKYTSSKLTKEGIYIIIGFKEKDSDGNYGLIYYFDEENNKFTKYNTDKCEYCND